MRPGRSVFGELLWFIIFHTQMVDAMERFQSSYHTGCFQMLASLCGLMGNLNLSLIHIKFLKGTCGEKMPLLLFLNITNVLMRLRKPRQTKLLGNMTMLPLTFRLTFTKMRV
uniref:Uncharacterized protein LOC105128029 isoform X1 n=1 Tax=Rhizophora mucronata TaxID=61149 RepID=A0A2P2KY13_RHIMU